jgi:hypothetical protein
LTFYFEHRGTIFTEYSILKMLHQDAGSMLPNLLSYNHFRMAWYSYLSLLDIDYAHGFQCDLCGTTQAIVLMDATTLSYRKEFDSSHFFLPEKNVQPLLSGR